MTVSFPGDVSGNPIPVLAPVYGGSIESAVTTTTGAAMAVNVGAADCIVRVMAIGCDVFYRAGTGATAPTVVDGLVFAGTYLDIPMTRAQTHIYPRARSGTGTARVELLG